MESAEQAVKVGDVGREKEFESSDDGELAVEFIPLRKIRESVVTVV